MRDDTTPFVLRDQHGARLRTLTNFYQMSVLLQEFKRADDQHQADTTLEKLQLDETAVDRTHRFIRDILERVDSAH